MRAILIDEPGSARLAEWSMPVPAPEEVVVRVRSVGVCAGDLHIYNGRNPYAVYPCIGGHEIAGEVQVVGASVTEWRPGDRVVVDTVTGNAHLDSGVASQNRVRALILPNKGDNGAPSFMSIGPKAN